MLITFIEFVAAFDSAFAASNRLNSRAPLVEVVSRRGKVLYCGWNMDRAVRLMAIHTKASGYMHTFDVDGRALLRIDMPR